MPNPTRLSTSEWRVTAWWQTTRRLRLTLALLAALVARPAVAVTFTAVPANCEAHLSAVDAQTGGRALIDTVDWTEWRNDLRAYGEDLRQANVGMSAIGLDADAALSIIRAATLDGRWTWGQKLSREAMLEIGKHPDFTLHDLAFWAALKGIDTALLVEGYLVRPRRILSSDERTRLAQHVTFWAKGPNAARAALAYLARPGFTGWHPSIAWLQSRLALEARRQFLARYFELVAARAWDPSQDSSTTYLGVAAGYGHNELPADIERILRTRWIDLERHPAVHSDLVRTVGTNVPWAGDCPVMSTEHVATLFPRAVDPILDLGTKKPILVFAKSHLIGLIKQRSDPSFLALRNVVDRDGRLTLIMGGVYQATLVGKRRLVPDGIDATAVTLSSLRVRALSFLLNDGARSGIPWRLIRAVLVERVPKARFREWFGDIRGQAPTNVTKAIEARDDRVGQVWFELLNALDDRRRELEHAITEGRGRE